VDPDIVVDNLPAATFRGGDAQLDEALRLLEDQIRTQPVPLPPAPTYPDKSLRPSTETGRDELTCMRLCLNLVPTGGQL